MRGCRVAALPPSAPPEPATMLSSRWPAGAPSHPDSRRQARSGSSSSSPSRHRHGVAVPRRCSGLRTIGMPVIGGLIRPLGRWLVGLSGACPWRGDGVAACQVQSTGSPSVFQCVPVRVHFRTRQLYTVICADWFQLPNGLPGRRWVPCPSSLQNLRIRKLLDSTSPIQARV